MNFKYLLPLVCIFFFQVNVKAQAKVLGECSLQFEVSQQKNNEWVPFGQKKVWVKGSQCKTSLITPLLTQTLIFNTQESQAIVLKLMGDGKFLQEIPYPPTGLPTLVSMKEMPTDSALFILGYPCKKMQLTWSDGVLYEILYTSEVIPSVNTFELAFKEVPGLVLSYTIINKDGLFIKYTASQIDLSPITLNQFMINKLEYQIL
ncbi:MAG: hypothetical protein EBV82_02935 [Chitinophagia bacterium]|jgi:hypothetical protein|nr:hypothetical protein [Chitinophagia bacterium]